MIDPRMFLGIGGPTPPQPMLPPGFRAPGPVSAPPPMQPQGGQMGVPGMGGMGGLGALAGMFGGGIGPDGISAAGLPGSEYYGPPSPEASAGMPGSDLFGPPSPGVGGSGSFMSWLKRLF